MESKPLSSRPCTDPDLLCKQSRFSCGWLCGLVTTQKVAQTFLVEKAQDCLVVPPVLFFLLATVWSAPWAQSQPKNRTEGSGKRQLTGEPTFLTQVPKESDANTPSALSIAFIYGLLLVPSPLGEGALHRRVLSTGVH